MNDSQTDFSGGMVDTVPPDRIPLNAYAFGQNIEIRNGLVRARRSTQLIWRSPKHWELMGSTIYRSSGGSEYMVLVCREGGEVTIHVLTLNSFKELYRAVFEARKGGTGILGIGEGQEIISVRFCQHYSRLYVLRGDYTYFWDGGVSDDGEYLFKLDSAFPKSDYALSAYGRIWAVHDGIEGTYDTLMYSDIYFGGDYPETGIWQPITQSYRIGAGRNERILSLIDIGSGKIAIIKENSLFVMHGCSGDLTELSLEQVDDTNGCIGFDAAARLGSDVWYLSRDGVHSAGVTAENYARAISVPISKPIENFIREYCNLTSLLVKDSTGLVYDNYVLFSFPYGGEGEVNAVLVYDLLNSCWVGIWTGVPCTRMMVSHTAWGHQRLLVLSAVNEEKEPQIRVFMVEDNGLVESENDENAFDSTVETRAYVCQDAGLQKRYLMCSLDAAANDSVVTVSAKPYDNPTETLCITKRIETKGWYILLPEEGLVFPNSEWVLYFASQKYVPVAFYTGIVTKAMQLRIRFRGTLQLGNANIRAMVIGDVHGRIVGA